MRLRHLGACGLAALAAYLATSVAAPAQTLDDRLRAELTSVLAQLHDLQNSQAALQAAKAAAERDRDALKAKLAKAGGGASRAASAQLQAQLDAEKARSAQLADQLQQAQADAAKIKDAYEQAAQLAQQTRAERDRFSSQADSGARALADCQTKNIQLLSIGREILTAYQRVGLGQALAKGEPVFGFERAKLERLAQDYGDQLYSAKFDLRTVKPPSAAAH
jgi:chromosome segregation ATPase